MTAKLTELDTKVPNLGEPKFTVANPLEYRLQGKNILITPYVDENGILDPASFEIAFPSNKLFFDPKTVKAGIVTCGGLCPGLNNAIRSIVMTLHHGYNCTEVYGFQYGLEGLNSKYNHPLIKLDLDKITKIHQEGGSILGISRGPQPIEEIVATLKKNQINQLYILGGDGTFKAAQKIADQILQQNLCISVITIPKTIDNDIPYVTRSFGFETAVDVACEAIRACHTEAKSVKNGVGLVRLMGRHSGFIAATAAISQRDVNYVLVPEQPFELHGKQGFLEHLKQRLKVTNHAVIVIAEGTGQDLFKQPNPQQDASGNIKLQDVGQMLKAEILHCFEQQNIQINVKYIDPSYMVRALPANHSDRLFAATLGQQAVYAAMMGKTSMFVSYWHGVYCYVPLKLAVNAHKTMSLNSQLWLNVLASTGQPVFINK